MQEKMVTINVRKPHGNKEDAMYVGVNGKTYLVKYGMNVQVPETVYYVIQQSIRAEMERDAFVEKING